MASEINNIVIEGHLLGTPIFREDGHIEFTLQNHEEWTSPTHGRQSRENLFGVITLPHTQPAKVMEQCPANAALTILGSLRTTTTTGPRGGTQTKTKISARRILRS